VLDHVDRSVAHRPLTESGRENRRRYTHTGRDGHF
jgi:hypothetical protein